MDEQKSFNGETLKNLELLNKQVSELITVQRKAVSGYDYLNANELAQLLGESIKTIYARVHNRQIPFYKPGGKILLFKLEEILDWIKSGRHSSIDELKQIV
ncbi:MAG: helix-turn-helix domain-containing protein [Bacteroidales bacterium]|nr:helix-turn-helix domain-containing protein [Bacteroidales bacterium]